CRTPLCADPPRNPRWYLPIAPLSDLRGDLFMAATVTPSLVHQFSAMKPCRLRGDDRAEVAGRPEARQRDPGRGREGHLMPLDGARTISSLTATLSGYDEFILREVSPETLLTSTPTRR